MKNVAIIGAGASGLVCSITAACRDVRVVLFDKNSFAGKKLLATGNGRCNYWNSDQSLSHYHSSEEDLLPNIITKSLENEVLDFFDLLGVVPMIKNGYYYPYSNQASSIRDLLEKEALRRGVVFAFDTEVLDVVLEEGKFVIVERDGREYFDDLVIATGSKASPKTGSTGFGYQIAEKFHHPIVPVRPSLVQLQCHGSFLKSWAGVRCQCSVSLFQDDVFLSSQEGEIQLTDYGVSGICVFNLSRYASIGLSQGKKISLKVNFLPFLDMTILDWLTSRGEQLSDYSMDLFLEGVLPSKLVSVILSCCGISSKAVFTSLSLEEKKKLSLMLVSFPLEVSGTKDFSSSQVCSGGVALSSVSSDLESKIVPRLYFTGEVLDVDGDCGGYNLGFSWMSGILVGKKIRGDLS